MTLHQQLVGQNLVDIAAVVGTVLLLGLYMAAVTTPSWGTLSARPGSTSRNQIGQSAIYCCCCCYVQSVLRCTCKFSARQHF